MLGFGVGPAAVRPVDGRRGLETRCTGFSATRDVRGPCRRARMAAAADDAAAHPEADLSLRGPLGDPDRDVVRNGEQTASLPGSTSRSSPPRRDANHEPAPDEPALVIPPAVSVSPPKPWDTTTGAQGVSFLERRMVFSRRRAQILRKAYSECERITRIYSKTFYLGSSLLPPAKRRAVWAIYVWCRRTDELVDGPRVNQRSPDLAKTLEDWNQRLERIFDGNPDDALDLTLSDVKQQFPTLDIVPFKEMIQGMLMDVQHDRYDTFRDLYVYCYRVASTVGLMTLPIMGASSEKEAVEPATALGIALQLTNILRDVGEDRLRGRIYLPLEDLAKFNYTEDDLMRGVLDDRYRRLMKFQIARARNYFAIAENGIPILSREARLPVRASLDMYSQILDALENNGYDNFTKRAYITKSQKFFTLPLSVLRIQPPGSAGKIAYSVIAPFFRR